MVPRRRSFEYDKAERRAELTATVSEAVADAFENAKAVRPRADTGLRPGYDVEPSIAD